MKNETELHKLIENYCADMLDQQKEEAKRYFHQTSGNLSYKMERTADNLMASDWDLLEFDNWLAVPLLDLPSVRDVRDAGLSLSFYHVDDDNDIDDDVYCNMDYLSNKDNGENIEKCITELKNYPNGAQ